MRITCPTCYRSIDTRDHVCAVQECAGALADARRHRAAQIAYRAEDRRWVRLGAFGAAGRAWVDAENARRAVLQSLRTARHYRAEIMHPTQP